MEQRGSRILICPVLSGCSASMAAPLVRGLGATADAVSWPTDQTFAPVVAVLTDHHEADAAISGRHD